MWEEGRRLDVVFLDDVVLGWDDGMFSGIGAGIASTDEGRRVAKKIRKREILIVVDGRG